MARGKGSPASSSMVAISSSVPQVYVRALFRAFRSSPLRRGAAWNPLCGTNPSHSSLHRRRLRHSSHILGILMLPKQSRRAPVGGGRGGCCAPLPGVAMPTKVLSGREAGSMVPFKLCCQYNPYTRRCQVRFCTILADSCLTRPCASGRMLYGKGTHMSAKTIGNAICGTVYVRDAPGRNKPCPCGSGRKWKRCCGRHPRP